MAIPQQIQCVDDLLLRRLLAEQLQAAEEAEVLAHIERCELCRDRLASLAGTGELEPEIREHLTDESFDGPGAATVLEGEAEEADIEQIKALLGPTEDPHMLGRIGHYEINAIVGRGSTGIVFKAMDKRLNRYVAIKMLAPSYAGSGAARQRFEREARSIAAVRDEHVIPVFAVDEHKGLPFIVMEYMPAGSLAQRIETEGSLDTCEVVRIGMQIARALEAAHKQGIVHRDVKPANVLLETGIDRALVTDFGLARILDEASMTRSGAISGTPQFMSPEQASGEAVDHRSDLFSLGSVMYMACTGHSPFRSETVFGVIKRVCDTEPRPIRETNPKIRKWLCDFITKLHAKDADTRFQTAKEVGNALAEELAYLQSPNQPKPDRQWRPVAAPGECDSKPPRLAIAVAIAVAAAAAGLFAFSQLADNNEGQEGTSGGQGVSQVPNGTNKARTEPQQRIADEAQDEQASPVAGGSSNALAVINREHKQSDFEKGMWAFEEEDYDKAIKLLTKAVATDDRGGTAQYNIACCYALTSRSDDALAWLRKACEAGFCDTEHYRSDDDLKSLRDDKRFKELLADIEKKEAAESLVSQGVHLRQQGRYAEANELYKRVLEQHPKHEHAIVEYGLSLHMLGKLDEAIEWHRRAAKTKSWDHYGNYNIACYHALKGNPDAAFVFFRKAIEAGMLEIRHFEEDEDLDPIREDERYGQMIQLAEKELRKTWSDQERASYRVIMAVRAKNYGEIESLLKNVDPNGSIPRYQSTRLSQPRWTPLCEACDIGDLKAAKLIIGAGANADFMQGWEPRPLMVAAGEGHVEIAKFLLECGARVNRNLPGVGTPITSAAAANEVDMIRFLLSEGASINSRVDGVGTALMVAARSGAMESARLMLNRSANINVQQPGVGTALSHAAKESQIEMMQLLLDEGAEIDAKIDGVGTPLSIAIRSGATEAVQFLLDEGAEINAPVAGSGTPLSTAAGCGDLELMRLLIKKKADLDGRAHGVGSALCVAARHGEVEATQLLLEAGARPDRTIEGVGTPLACAVKHDEHDVVRELLKYGADPEATSPGHKSAIAIARKHGDKEMMDLFRASDQ